MAWRGNIKTCKLSITIILLSLIILKFQTYVVNILSLFLIFPISICGFVAEGQIENLSTIEKQFINRGAFAVASVIHIFN